ncbi:MAG: PorT family protein [Cytophagaceae bacterium]|nr:PorT family protein [Cytophagaceae bacterium]
MKKISHLFLLFLLFSGSFTAFSQQIGVRAGANLANLLIKDDDENGFKPGLNLGVIGEYPLTETIFVESGLLFSQKGSKYSVTEDGDKLSVAVGLNYLEIPIFAKVYHELDNDLQVFGSVGPYIGVGVTGKYKIKLTIDGESDSESEKIVYGEDIKRLDYGLGIGAGVRKEKMQVGLNFNLGLANLNTDGDSSSSTKNMVIGLNFTYFLGD